MADDPERLLDEWLGQLDNLAEGLDNVGAASAVVPRRRAAAPNHAAPRMDGFRFSMANLEDTEEVDLDAILGELSQLESECQQAINRQAEKKKQPDAGKRTSLCSSEGAGQQRVSFLSETESELTLRSSTNGTRTESPDNDSAFSDNVSLLSGESSASSGGSGGRTDASSKSSGLGFGFSQMDEASKEKAEKIRIALEKMREANVKKLFVKAFSADDSTKSLLVDEKMTCAHVTRLLADKNHVDMGPQWAVVEHIPELHMERIFEDHELLVDNLMLWARDSKNKLLFVDRPDKNSFFSEPERLLVPEWGGERLGAGAREDLLDEFFNGSSVAPVEGPLFLKEKRGWRKLHFVLRASGLYFVKGRRDLVCLAPLDANEVYRGLGWRKRLKAPTDFCFALKHPRLQKGLKFVHLLCAESPEALDRWVTAVRLAKHGRLLQDAFRAAAAPLDPPDTHTILRRPLRGPSPPEPQVPFASPLRQVRFQPPSSPPSESPLGTSQPPFRTSLPLLGTSQPPYGTLQPGTSEPLLGTSEPPIRTSQPPLRTSLPPSPRKQLRHSASQEEPFEADAPPVSTIKRKPPSLKPQLPLTPTTRQLSELVLPAPLAPALKRDPPPPPPTEDDDFPPPPPPLAASELGASVMSLDVPPPPPPPKPSSRRISFKPPPPPKRSESTRLSSGPAPAEAAPPAPSPSFLSDLQRVMRRNWQVAEKCKREGNTTPHEVLGFRDPRAAASPAPLDYRETNVTNWLAEHYGCSLYENLPLSPNAAGGQAAAKRPPPPPLRSLHTQLTPHPF